jgi:hypothetical protein
MHHPFVIAVLIVSRWVVNAFRRNTMRGIHGAAFSLQLAVTVSGWMSIAWWAALGFAIWKYVP